jgi:hypothetical protein
MDAEAYNRLAYRNNNSTVPCYLILLCLPSNRDEWLVVNTDELILRKCCYFHLINGSTTPNKKSLRISIPKINKFDSDAVIQLIQLSKQAVLS